MKLEAGKTYDFDWSLSQSTPKAYFRNMKYSVDMTDNQTGERKLIPFDQLWSDHEWWWREGNFACDCNRVGVFYSDCWMDSDCNGSRFTVHKVILENGDEIRIDDI